MDTNHNVSRSGFPSLLVSYLSFPDHFSVYAAAFSAGHADDGGLSVTKPDPGVDPGHKEAFAPPAGEPVEGWVEADIEFELHIPCQGSLLLGDGRIGASQADG